MSADDDFYCGAGGEFDFSVPRRGPSSSSFHAGARSMHGSASLQVCYVNDVAADLDRDQSTAIHPAATSSSTAAAAHRYHPKPDVIPKSISEVLYTVVHNKRATFYPRESEGICFHRRWFVYVSVCLSVTTITKKLWTDLHQILCEGSQGEREDQVRVSLRSVQGCGSTGQKLRKPAIVYKIAPLGNSKSADRKIVSVASVGDKNAFAGICTLSEYFPSSF